MKGKKMSKGKFIVLKGGEGSGKTSVINFLKEKFINNKDIVFTREPGGTTIGEKIRNLLMDKDNKDILPITELFLFCGARAQHMEELVIPALNSGKSVISVISDRFDISTIAYQLFGRQRTELVRTFEKLNDIAKNGVKVDAIIWFDVSPEIGLLRKKKSQEGLTTRFDKEKIEFRERVRMGFKSCFERSENINAPSSAMEKLFFENNSEHFEANTTPRIWHRIDTDKISLDGVKKETLRLIKKFLILKRKEMKDDKREVIIAHQC